MIKTLQKTAFFACFLALLSCAQLQKNSVKSATNEGWPSFGRDYTSQRFAPATQINIANVNKLVRSEERRVGKECA